MPGSSTASQTEADIRPAVYGYLRSDGTDEAEVASLRADLKLFCASRGWRLVTVFCDRGCDGLDVARSGFAGALDALVLPESTALVVPSLEHLSPDDAVRAALTSMVRRAGARVVAAEDSTDEPTTDVVNNKADDVADNVSDTGTSR
jgi:DNA invertase Pin-like site-specific DNA recombinase